MKAGERTDQDYARLAQRGDAKAYEALVRRHQGRVYRHLLHMTGSREEALELAQDAFIKAWQALATWRPQAQFATWLLRIASNAALDVLRRRRIVAYTALDEDYDAPSDAPGPEAQLDARQRLARLDSALAQLTPEHREIVLLREVEGLSYDEIAEVLGVDEGTVKSRLARARMALAAAYKRTDS